MWLIFDFFQIHSIKSLQIDSFSYMNCGCFTIKACKSQIIYMLNYSRQINRTATVTENWKSTNKLSVYLDFQIKKPPIFKHPQCTNLENIIGHRYFWVVFCSGSFLTKNLLMMIMLIKWNHRNWFQNISSRILKYYSWSAHHIFIIIIFLRLMSNSFFICRNRKHNSKKNVLFNRKSLKPSFVAL